MNWLAYFCAINGHLVLGVGWGTSDADIIWDSHCSRCGAEVSA